MILGWAVSVVYYKNAWGVTGDVDGEVPLESGAHIRAYIYDQCLISSKR